MSRELNTGFSLVDIVEAYRQNRDSRSLMEYVSPRSMQMILDLIEFPKGVTIQIENKVKLALCKDDVDWLNDDVVVAVAYNTMNKYCVAFPSI